MMRDKLGQFSRFILGGGLNTAVTFVLFIVLARMMPTALAYTLTYLFGIVLAYVINSRFVFKSAVGWRTLWRYPLVYVVQYLYGLALLSILVGYLGLKNEYAAVILVVTTVPITFAMTKMVLVPMRRRAPDQNDAFPPGSIPRGGGLDPE